MKKFTKVCLIIAAVLGGVGLFLCGIASAMGGYGTIRQLAEDGKLNHGNWHIGRIGIYYGDDWDENDINTDVHGHTVEHTVTDAEAGTDGAAYVYETEKIQKLDIDIGAANVLFTEGEREDAVVVTLYNCRENDYEGAVEDDTLHIEYETEHIAYTGNTDMKVVVEIPAGMSFDTVDIDMGAANVEFALSDISCNTLHMDVGAANVIADEFNVKELFDVSVGAGNVEIYDGSYGNIKVSCGMGNFTMTGAVTGNVKAECGMGNLDMNLGGNPEAYDYDLSCGAGDMVVNGVQYGGIAGKHHLKNDDAVGTIDIECGMGSVKFIME